jgi:hypothetical protein
MKEKVNRKNHTASGQFQNQVPFLGIPMPCCYNGKYIDEMMVFFFSLGGV